MKWNEVLRQERLKHKLKMKQVAEDNNIKADTYRRWERGEREPDIASLIQIAKYYNISLDYLMGRYSDSND